MKIKPLVYLPFFFIFVFINIPVFGFDIFPDAFGYFGLFVTCTALLEHERSFVKPQNFALLLTFLDLAIIFKLVSNENLLQLLRLAGVFGNMLVVVYTVSALRSLALKHEYVDISNKAERILYYFAPTILFSAISPFLPELFRLMFFTSMVLYAFTLYNFYFIYRNLLLKVEIVPEIQPELEAGLDSIPDMDFGETETADE